MQHSYKIFALPLSRIYCVFLFGCMALAGRLSAQASIILPDSAAHAATKAYQAAVGYAARLYSGPEYIRTYPGTAGHPFLATDTVQRGTITYDGVLYTDVLLNYDIVRGEVIVNGPQAFALRLVQRKIDSFSMNGRRMVCVADANPYKLAQGCYELLHSNKVQVLAKSVKQITTPSRTDELSTFAMVTAYFVLKNGVAYKVSDKKELLQAFSDQKAAVQKYVQQANLNIRKNPGQTLKQIAAFYDQIQN